VVDRELRILPDPGLNPKKKAVSAIPVGLKCET